jgi:hypothetical protein
MIEIHKLFEKESKKKDLRLKAYNKVLNKVTNRIKFSTRSGKTEVIYEMPKIIFGMPSYKPNVCGIYIGTELKKNGFDIIYPFRGSPIHIFISWKKYKNQIVNKTKPIEHFNKREKRNVRLLKDKNSSSVKRHFKNLNNKIINEYKEKKIINKVNRKKPKIRLERPPSPESESDNEQLEFDLPRNNFSQSGPGMTIDHTNQEFINNLKYKYGLN